MTTARVNGIDLHYELVGPEGAPVIAFSNSLGSAVDMWRGVVAGLAGAYRCLTYDTRGHGSSGTSDAPVTVDGLADDLAGLLDALGIDRAHIVGLSLGGMIGQALASRRPEKVRTLTLIATGPHLPPPDFWRKRAATVRAEGPAAVVDTILPRWFTAGFRERDPDAVARTRASFLRIDPAGYARCCEAIADMDLRDRLGAIAAPTLVIAGAEDPVAPPALAETLRQGIPVAELVVLPDAAHLISVEKPEAIAAHLVTFLALLGDAPSASGDAFQAGLAVRKSVLGPDYVEGALKKAGTFGQPWQDFITRVAWGEVWGDETLPRKTRSLLTLAMMIALHREEEFKLHLKPALGNGVSAAEIMALIKQAAIYAGIPAGNAAMRWTREALGDGFGGNKNNTGSVRLDDV